MGLLNWIRGLPLVRNYQKQQETASDTPLREFVYLDEISVHSLQSSQIGAAPSEITDSASIARKGEISSEISGGLPTTAKAKLGGKYEDSRTSGTQILRKMSVQAAFKDFHEDKQADFLLGKADEVIVTKKTTNLASLISQGNSAGAGTRLILEETELRRGCLIELNVRLSPDPIFHTSAAIDAMTSLVRENSIFGSAIKTEDFRMASDLNSILNGLMVGLIPIRCQLVDYQVVTHEGRRYLAHRESLKNLTEALAEPVEDAFLVAVTENDLYWKDIRRVLFSESEFRILARVSSSGLLESWTPVKLVDVLKRVAPGIADQIDTIGDFSTLPRNQILDAPNTPIEANDSIVEERLSYGRALLSRAHGELMTPEIETAVREIPIPDQYSLSTIAGRREALAPVVVVIDKILDSQTAPELASDIRAEMATADAAEPEEISARPAPISGEQVQRSSHLIQAEVVAIYW